MGHPLIMLQLDEENSVKISCKLVNI